MQPVHAALGLVDQALRLRQVVAGGSQVIADEGEVGEQRQLVLLAQLVANELPRQADEDGDDEDRDQRDRQADLRRHRAPEPPEAAPQQAVGRLHSLRASKR